MTTRTAPKTDRPRLNVLLTEDRTQPEEYWTVQLSRLLEPMGVAAFLARSGEEALDLLGQLDFHVAVIDLGTPKKTTAQALRGPVYDPAAHLAGLWILEQLKRLPRRPPVVVVDRPVFNPQESERILRDILRLGAFSVLHKPVHLEQLLMVLQRLVERRYEGYWPTRGETPRGN